MMPNIYRVCLLPSLVCTISCAQVDDQPDPISYFEQTPPGLTSEILGPGTLSSRSNELNCAFTPDGNEVYFTIRRNGRYTLMKMQRTDEGWSDRAVVPFSGTYADVDPFITHDGRRLYYSSKRPIDPDNSSGDSNIWFVERTDSGAWSEPSCDGIPNTPGRDDYYTSITRDGTIYTSIFGPGGSANVYRSPLVDGEHAPFERVANVNSEQQDHDPYVAADESYLIFTSMRPGGRGYKDLYISFREDGAWTEPRNMGPAINTSRDEWCPMLSPDGRYLIYTGDGDIRWIDISIIESLRPPPA